MEKREHAAFARDALQAPRWSHPVGRPDREAAPRAKIGVADLRPAVGLASPFLAAMWPLAKIGTKLGIVAHALPFFIRELRREGTDCLCRIRCNGRDACVPRNARACANPT
ncbi:MAG: hypothetical protein JWO52_2058 [Gammaproteobacteria bacterium]|nr:hypothetical protein [Gammaproteobacteria bacterium]